jgi:peptidoglycan hydrolase-like protein with peptidoglycan-binding domain
MKSAGYRRRIARERQALKRPQRHVSGQDDYELPQAASAARASLDTPDALHPTHILALQRTVGNQAVQRLLAHEQPAQGGVRIQRAPLTAEEKAENLTASRFAGDARLEEVFDNSPAMFYGEKSDAVAKIQQALVDLGYPMPISTRKTGSPDGIFGSETRATVKQFQRDHGLYPDGIVGRKTLGELDRIFGNPPAKDPEIEATEEALGQHMVEGVHKINDGSSFSPTSGVWYSHNYEDEHIKDPERFPWNPDYRNGYANPTYWERLGWMEWRLKPNKSASEGIKAWLEGLTIAECFTALVAIELDSVRAAIGDAKFDERFGSTTNRLPDESRLHIKQSIVGTSLEGLMKWTDAANAGDAGVMGNRPAKEGDWYYFYNHPRYLLKHPAGAFQGENAVYMGKNDAGVQLWAGMGVPDTDEVGMLKEMADAYNVERDERDYEHIVKYRTITPIPIPPGNPSWKALYEANLDKIRPEYRPETGEFPDAIDWTEILSAPEYEIDGTKRKGGFVAGAGKQLDADKIKAMREE